VKKKIAIIGSGISGLIAANELTKKYQVDLYEKNSYLGGHTHTHRLKEDKKNFFLDSGFIVFNKKTYPNFFSFLRKYKVQYQKTEMSFSINYPKENFEWSGRNLKTLIIKNKFFFSLKFLKIFFSILKWRFIRKNTKEQNLGINSFLKKKNFSQEFKKYYFFPLCASIWSNPIEKIKNYKTIFFLQFFKNHGLNNLIFRPQWLTIKNGSHNYINKIKRNKKIRFLLNNQIKFLKLNNSKIIIKKKTYDYLIFANHSDEIKRMLPNSFKKEKEILSYIKYQKNTAQIHCDEDIMPRNKYNWSSWNFIQNHNNTISLTYWMNLLQNLKTKKNYFVSINGENFINKKKIIKHITYHHPVFSISKESFHKKIQSIQGRSNIFYCGAWCGYGFHEDGYNAALSVVKKLI